MVVGEQLFFKTWMVLVMAGVAMATCNNPQTSCCSGALGAVFQDVGNRVGVPGRYYMSHPSITHFDAQYACNRSHGFLLEVDTQQEMDLIRNAIDDLLMDSIVVHIGGTYHQDSGNVTSEASPARQLYTDWHTGHPSSQPQRACVSLFRRSRNRGIRMGSVDCDESSRRFICEI